MSFQDVSEGSTWRGIGYIDQNSTREEKRGCAVIFIMQKSCHKSQNKGHPVAIKKG